MRQINATGTGLQLWDVSRFYAELYEKETDAVPAEVWTSEIMSLNLPRTRLGGCAEGSLTLAVDPLAGLPAGFALSGIPAQPVRCSLVPFSRLVRIIAVLPNGDEWVIYTGVLGKLQGTQPGAWNVPLIGPDSVVMQMFVSANLPLPTLPTPAGMRPLAGTSRVFSAAGPAGQGSAPYSAPDATLTTTFEGWWKAALQADPMGEYCVGPDLVFTAGTPLGTQATRATYAFDWRAEGLTSQGSEVPPYLTFARGFITADYLRDTERPAGSAPLPRFTPIRTATFGGQLEVQTVENTVRLGAYGAGNLSVNAKTSSGTGIGAPVSVSGAIIAASLTGDISIDMTEAMIGKVAIRVYGQVSGANGSTEVMSQQFLAVPGRFALTLAADAKTLEGCNHLTMQFHLIGLTNDASATASVSAGEAWVKTQSTVQTETWEQAPPGLNYPAITDESWTFSLPGVHAGPLLVTGLPNGDQYATTVIRTSEGTGGKAPELWTDVRCGPLPYNSSPVNPQTGRWTG